MNDIIQWARLDDLSATVSALTWPAPSYMYLEQVPDRWLSQEEQDRGPRLEKLDRDVSFEAWERGRVFCAAFELRWEKLDGAFQAVYVGPPVALSDFEPANELDLGHAEFRERSYDLWGNRIPDAQLETVGVPTGTEMGAFMEFKIPRVLLYPVSAEARRVRLRVCEYVDPRSGELCYYRFKGLEEA